MTLLEIVLSCLLVLETIVMIVVVYSFFKLKKMLTSSLAKTGSKLLESMMLSQTGSNNVHDISDMLDKMMDRAMADRHNYEKTADRKGLVNPQPEKPDGKNVNESLNKSLSDIELTEKEKEYLADAANKMFTDIELKEIMLSQKALQEYNDKLKK